MSAEIALRNGAATLPTPENVEANVSPRRPKPLEESDTAIWISPKIRNLVYVGRELGLPYACVLGVFGLLACLFWYVLLPQNQQSIDNQKALQTGIAKIVETNAAWAVIEDKRVTNEARIQPALDALTTEIRGLRSEVRELRGK